MSNWIDSILSETRTTTTTTSNVISVNNDTGTINFVNGMSDPGEMIACGYRPELRRADGESDEVYAERIRPLVMALPREERDKILSAAVNRAGLDTTHGRVAVMVAGKAPWHRLGVHLAETVSSAEAIQHSGLNWSVSMKPLAYDYNGMIMQQTEARAIVRDDTGACLGIVGSRYEPIQNAQGFSFLDSVLSEYGAKYTSAGALHQGRQVWMLADLPGCRFSVASGDETVCYCIFSNPHDGSGKAYCYPTTERVVCGNSLRVSTKDKGKGIGIRHSGSVKSKIDSAKLALSQSVAGFRAFAEDAQTLARTRVRTVNPYFNAVLDEILPVNSMDVQIGANAVARARCKADVNPDDFLYAVKTAEKEIKTRGEILADIMERYESEQCNRGGGTAWDVLNAMTSHADHYADRRRVGTQEAQQSRRFESVLSGDRDEMKQIALTQALALTR